MSENTQKLDLLMKDPVLDGHEYFNVKTMMNDNWEKIDAFAETVDGEVKELQQRLDTEQRKEITLQPGLQIIESDKTVPFRLTGLKGRTLVNLLGRDGNCENINRFTPTRAVLTADTTIKTQGTQSLKITSTGLPTGAATGQSFSVKAGSYYILVGDVRLGSGTYAGPHVAGISNTKNNGNATDTTNFSTVWRAYSALSNAATVSLVSEVAGPVGSVAYFDALRFYEITAEEYAALDDMSAEQVGAKYPYVDSVKPVRNPYVIRYGENLLPPFYEWENLGARKVITGPYSFTLSSDAASGYPFRVFIPIVAGENYRLSAVTTGFESQPRDGVYSYFTDAGKIRITERDFNQTKTAPVGAAYIEVVLNNDISLSNSNPNTLLAGTFTFKDVMLSAGSEALSFVPREDSTLALQTDLYADLLTGANADSVFERGGQYFKSKMWERIVLSSEQPWEVAFTPPGFKGVRYQHNKNVVQRSSIGVKYDGKLLFEYGGDQAADKITIDNISAFVWISNTDSGWGDSYAGLTRDEIKAYFMGWRMRDQVTTAPYSGGVKAWGSLMSGGTDYYTNTLPTTVAPDFKMYYELVYQLAIPTVEPIVSEGQIALNEGSNQIEIGAGIVLRENIQAAKDAGGKWNLGNTAASATAVGFKNAASRVLNVYENGRDDAGWIKASIAQEITAGSTYNQDAAYTVTYLMRDASPVSAFIGSVPDNEKSLLADLVQDVQQASTRLSVVESKKAEKDSPSWISPTLLGGWTSSFNFGYRLEGNRVYFRGVLIAGTATQLQVLFTLPPELRTKRSFTASLGQYNSSTGATSEAALDFLADGRVSIVIAAATRIVFEGFSYAID